MPEFVDREEELAFLQNRYESGDAELLIVYGRRRMGKSELARQSIRDRDDAIYYQATESTPAVQIENFVEVAAEVYPRVSDLRRDWEAVLGYLGEQDAVVVIDEFPYLITADDAIPSLFQRVWDTELQNTSMSLVLIGSSISIMEEKVLSGGSPLHGRRTGSLDLEPLSIDAARQFYPKYDPETTAETWSVFGGTPHYLQSLDPDADLSDNIQSTILSQQGILHDEPEFLLRTELEKPNTYFSLLQAMAQGKGVRNEIAQAAGVDTNTIGSYLAKLERLRLVERDVPVTESPKHSRRGRYRLRDPLFRFWFRFVYGQQDRLQLLGDDAYDRLIEPELADHASQSFENLCQEALPALRDYPYTRIGRWWYKDAELDVVGLTEAGTLLAGECKFTNTPVGQSVLENLEETAEQVRWNPPDVQEVTTEYHLFSRSGYTDAVESEADGRDDLFLHTIPDVLQAIEAR